MNLDDLNKIQHDSRGHKLKSDRLLTAQKEIADLRGSEMRQIMEKLTAKITANVYGDESKEATEDLALALDKAWPDLCRQVELKLIAKARIEQNRSKMLQAQVDSFFPDSDSADG